MSQEYSKVFYNTTAWKECRKAYIKSVSGLCEDCLAKGIYTPAKVVHHKTWISPDNINDASVTLNWDNLKAVCQDCHAKEHSKEKRYKFDESGNVILI